MAAELALKVSKGSYQDRITILDAKLAALNDVLQEYRELNNNVTSFMGETDDNFTNMQENVRANIDAVKRAIAATQESKSILQKTLDAMDTTSENIGKIMREGVDLAKNTIETAIKATTLLD